MAKVRYESGEQDGATAIAHELDVKAALANASAKLLSIKNAGVEKFYVDKDGNLKVPAGLSVGMQSSPPDSAGSVAYLLNSTVLSGDTRELLSVRNNNLEKFGVAATGTTTIGGTPGGYTPQPTAKLIVNGTLMELGDGSGNVGFEFKSGAAGAYISDGSLFWIHLLKSCNGLIQFDQTSRFSVNKGIVYTAHASGGAGAGSPCFQILNENTLSGSDDRLFGLYNNTVEKFWVYADGTLKTYGALTANDRSETSSVAASGSITVIDNAIDALDAVGILFEGTSYQVTEGTDWAIGGNANATAANIATAINNKVILKDIVTAVATLNVIAITANWPGSDGNQIGLFEADHTTDNFTLSGTYLSGGTSTGHGFILNTPHRFIATTNRRLLSVRNNFVEKVGILPDGTILAPFAKFGGTTHYSEFEADGTYHMAGDATVWDDITVPGLSVRPSGSLPPALTSGFAGNANLYTYQFIGTGGSVNECYFSIQLPHGWKEGSTIYPHVHWTPTDANAGDVKWQLEYTWANLNTAFGGSTADSVVSAASGTAWQSQVSGFTPIVGTGKTISSILVCRLFRDPADVADTYAHDVSLISFDIHIEKDTIGSRGITTK